MFCILKGHFRLLLSFHSEIPFKSGLRACVCFFNPHVARSAMAIFPIVFALGTLLHDEVQNSDVCQSSGTWVDLRLGCVFVVDGVGQNKTKETSSFEISGVCEACCQVFQTPVGHREACTSVLDGSGLKSWFYHLFPRRPGPIIRLDPKKLRAVDHSYPQKWQSHTALPKCSPL